jgi:hypothetical protein
LRDATITPRNNANNAEAAASGAHAAATAIRNEFMTQTGIVESKRVATLTAKGACAQALSDAAQYQATQAQIDAHQRAVTACGLADTAYTNA